jgi:hypothetical protein
LIDSEAPVSGARPWTHLKTRDNWEKPENADENDCHLMVQIMETWFLADKAALKTYFEDSTYWESLSVRDDIENIAKDDVFLHLENAARHTRKGAYSKGKHSFEILAKIDCNAVISKSFWAKRFIDSLTCRMQTS